MSQSSRKEKRRHLEEMLRQGRGMVMVHLDPRREGVQVPPQFSGDPVLRLNIAFGFNLPALDVDDGGVYAMLSFGGRRFGCNLPWDAIFALTMPDEDHSGVVWPDDLPYELRPFFEAIDDTQRDANLAAVQLGGAVVAGTEPPKAKLSLVSEAPPEPAAPDDSEVDDAEADDAQAGERLSTPAESATDDSEPSPPAPKDGDGKPRRPTLRLVK